MSRQSLKKENYKMSNDAISVGSSVEATIEATVKATVVGNSVVTIISSIERLIRLGQWHAGYKLPPVRKLAEELNVNASTVSSAYKQLRNTGMIITKGRQGTFVCESIVIEHTEMPIPEGLFDLASGNVDGRLLPKINPKWLNEYHLYSGYENVSDNANLLTLFTQELPNDTKWESVLFSSTLDAIERALMQRCVAGSKVLVEDPCWQPVMQLIKRLRLDAVPMALDAEGAILPEQSLKDISAIIMTPKAHNPTGINYSASRWQSITKHLSGHDMLVIIDDYWHQLSYTPRVNLSNLQNEFIYIQSVSKFLGPDFRIALATGNGGIIKSMKNRFGLGPRWVSGLLQFLAYKTWQSLLVDDTAPNQHEDTLLQVKQAYKARRNAVIILLKNNDINIDDNGEGLHIWLPVYNETQAVHALASKGWAVQAGSIFTSSKSTKSNDSFIRVSIGNLALEMCETFVKDMMDIQVLTNKM